MDFYGIIMYDRGVMIMHNYELEVPISRKNDALVKEDDKCIKCGYCKKICKIHII